MYKRQSEKKLLAYVSPKLNFKNNFSGFLGVANEGETRSISGEIQFHFENLWHTAEIIDVQLKRWKKLSEILLLSVQKPLLFHFPFGAKLEYRYEVNEGLYLKMQSSLGVLSRGHGIGNWEFTGLNTIVEPTETGIEKGGGVSEPNIKTNQVEKWMLQRPAQLQMLNNIQIRFTVAGDTTRHVGDVVNFEMPSHLRDDSNQLYAGKYLVTQIRHRFGTNEFKTEMQLSKDSFNTKMDMQKRSPENSLTEEEFMEQTAAEGGYLT